MSRAQDLLSRLLVARDGVSTAERQAQARIKTRDYLERDKREMRGQSGDDITVIIKETGAEITALRAVAEAAGDTILVEIYDAALSVFATWTVARDKATEA